MHFNNIFKIAEEDFDQWRNELLTQKEAILNSLSPKENPECLSLGNEIKNEAAAATEQEKDSFNVELTGRFSLDLKNGETANMEENQV